MNRISELIHLDNHAVAIYREKTIPDDAAVPHGHCTIPGLLVKCATRGVKCASDSEHSPCHGSKSGFGFGGISSRHRTSCSLSVVPEEMQAGSRHQGSGQSLFADQEIALLQIDPIKDYGDGTDVIVFQDLDEALSENRDIEVVVFLTDPVRMSSLVQLAGYSKRTPGPAAVMPYGHACQQIYAIPRAEGESDDPHAVVGMTDMYARRFVKGYQMSVAVPYNLFERMLADAEKSFLTKEKYQENLRRCLDRGQVTREQDE